METQWEIFSAFFKIGHYGQDRTMKKGIIMLGGGLRLPLKALN